MHGGIDGGTSHPLKKEIGRGSEIGLESDPSWREWRSGENCMSYRQQNLVKSRQKINFFQVSGRFSRRPDFQLHFDVFISVDPFDLASESWFFHCYLAELFNTPSTLVTQLLVSKHWMASVNKFPLGMIPIFSRNLMPHQMALVSFLRMLSYLLL